MRPALQRLLSRPSSLDFLHVLLGRPLPTPNTTPRRCIKGKSSPCRRYTNAALGLQEHTEVTAREAYDNEIENPVPTRISRDENERTYEGRISREAQEHRGNFIESAAQEHTALKPSSPQDFEIFGAWAKRTWTRKELEFESALDQPAKTPRLLDQAPYKHDLELWAFLLDYRTRKDGYEAVAVFVKAFRETGVRLKRYSEYRGGVLGTFMEAGFKNPLILSQIMGFTVERWITEDSLGRRGLATRRRRRGNGLYFRIMQHFLRNGLGAEALHWHDILSPHVSLPDNAFAELILSAARAGDLNSLEKLYHHWKLYNVYSKIVPVLCGLNKYKDAVRWHFICLESGDLPSSSDNIRPLLQFLRVHSPPDAQTISQSLVEREIPFASSLSEPQAKAIFSREVMNIMHGETINVPPIAYNDPLGARWFATSWISLDVAINTIHALGMTEIGPLSLQAIALRDPDPFSISSRIKQLKGLGISIGNSMFSKAVDSFSRNRNHEYLAGLLASDQHPDQLEDANLQENLLLEYTRAKDWTQYRRTLAIQALRSKGAKIEKKNIILRIHAARGDQRAVLETLADMNRDRIMVKTKSIPRILRSILSHRTPGRRPVAKGDSAMIELKLATHVLRSIMMSGSYVPTTSWREILRRLGMRGNTTELQSLSLFLAEWYITRRHTAFKPKFHVPFEAGTSSQVDPLVNLFSARYQQAVVEWGFIRGLNNMRYHASPQRLPDITSGITLLKLLHQRGIEIDYAAVKRGIINRLVAYCGPGNSNVHHNRLARRKLGIHLGDRANTAWSLDQMRIQIDAALGGKFLTATNLRSMIESIGRKRIMKAHRTRQRRLPQVAWGRVG